MEAISEDINLVSLKRPSSLFCSYVVQSNFFKGITVKRRNQNSSLFTSSTSLTSLALILTTLISSYSGTSKIHQKRHKNCECCPVSLFFVRSLWMSGIPTPPTQKYKNCWFLLFGGILWSDKISWYNGPRGVMSHGCTLRIYVKKRKQRNLTETKERKQESDKRWCNVMGSPPGQISHCYTLRILRDISWSSKIFGTTNTFVEQTNMGLFGMFMF